MKVAPYHGVIHIYDGPVLIARTAAGVEIHSNEIFWTYCRATLAYKDAPPIEGIPTCIRCVAAK